MPTLRPTHFPLTTLLRAPMIRASSRYISTSSLPRVVQPSLWQSLIPKPLRRSTDSSTSLQPRPSFWSRPWNPATIYIVLALLVGSQAIQLMNVRRYTANLTRESEARLSALREVIERVNKGEDVNVEDILGRGRKADEEGWERTMHEIEHEDRLFAQKAKRASKRPTEEGSQASQESSADKTTISSEPAQPEPANRPPRFV